ncbi:MAG: heparinase II/III family protein [Eubacteriales bacterium]|nr:heparinase II/III family protein [Eubacteriales bacterium]
MLINIKKLRNKCENNPVAKDFINRLKAEAEKADYKAMMNAIVVEDKYATGFYLSSFTLMKLAFLRAITGDRKYDEVLKEVILKISEYPEWVSQGKGNGWDTDLLTGDVSATLSTAYYLSKDLFSTEECDKIETNICEKGIIPIYNEWVNPETKRHSLDTMGHNWWSVCVGGAGIALILAGDKISNKCEILTYIAQGFKDWLAYQGDIQYNKHRNFGEDGDYIEYAGYMLYGLTNFTVFEELYRRATGKRDLIDVVALDKTCDFALSFMHEIHGDGKLSFAKMGDTHSNNSNSLVFLYLANLYNRGDMVTAYMKFRYNLINGFDFIHLENINAEPQPIVCKPLAVFHNTGIASYRENDIFMPIKTGETGCHNHRDTGHYMITYKNAEIVIDSGTCKYSKAEYLPYFCAPSAHNVILFNGQGVREDGMYGGGVHGVGTIESTIDKPGFKYILADCTVPYLNVLQKNFRHFIMLKDVILVIDDVYAETEGDFESLLHYRGSLTGTGEEQYIENGNVRVKVMHIAPFDFDLVEKMGMSEINGETIERKYVSVKAKSENRKQKFVRGFVFDDGLEITKKRTGDILEVCIDRGEYTEKILINYGVDRVDMYNSPHFEYGRVKTNAFITYLKEDDNLLGIGLIDGFYCRYDGELIYTDTVNNEVYIER